jgi:hypothetical protein
MFTKSNYTEWALVMEAKLKARNLWDSIEPGGVLEQEDRLSLDAITNVVPQESDDRDEGHDSRGLGGNQ